MTTYDDVHQEALDYSRTPKGRAEAWPEPGPDPADWSDVGWDEDEDCDDD